MNRIYLYDLTLNNPLSLPFFSFIIMKLFCLNFLSTIKIFLPILLLFFFFSKLFSFIVIQKRYLSLNYLKKYNYRKYLLIDNCLITLFIYIKKKVFNKKKSIFILFLFFIFILFYYSTIIFYYILLFL
jgi:hypothetical protein